MRQERISIEAKEVVIRPMDEGHVIDGCAHHRRKGLSHPAFRRFHKELMKRYGNSAILAWSGDEIVGFANFYPAALQPPVALCPDVDSEPEGKFGETQWPDSPGDTLSISCVNISRAFQRKGIGTKLVRHVIDWARENGYRRILAGANDTQWWIPCRPFWEELGFRVKETEEFPEPREDGEVRVHTMELLL